MTSTTEPLIETNPFSTSRVRPGAIPFFFPHGESIEQLVSRLRANNWRSQIIGPHGSGKSTLLASLIAELRRVGVRTVDHELHDWSARLPAGWRRDLAAGSQTLLVIDGFEILPLPARISIRLETRFRGCGLLVTAHEPIGLPDLYRTAVMPCVAQSIVNALLQDSRHAVSEREIAARLAAHGGNMRATLFDLYDLVEARRRLCPAN